jgi:guanylate kinase
MIILLGESASGKSTVEKELCRNHGMKKIISYTTRQPREGEVDGIDYHFISKEKFNELKKSGFFAEIGYYNGWWYGSAVEDCTDDKVAVLTPHGFRQLKVINGLNITSFYINVPRRDRLIKILQRGDDIEESYRRSLSDVGQFDGIEDEVDRVIHNDGYLKPSDVIAEIIINTVKESE